MKTNLAAWSHDSLVSLTENLQSANATLHANTALMASENLQLREDIKAALAAWRTELLKGKT